MSIQGGLFCFCFSLSRCFICIDILWASGSLIFSPPLFFGKNNVFLAIGSEVLFCHRYLNVSLCIS